MRTGFYQNQLDFVEDMTKTFWCVFHSIDLYSPLSVADTTQQRRTKMNTRRRSRDFNPLNGRDVDWLNLAIQV